MCVLCKRIKLEFITGLVTKMDDGRPYACVYMVTFDTPSTLKTI